MFQYRNTDLTAPSAFKAHTDIQVYQVFLLIGKIMKLQTQKIIGTRNYTISTSYITHFFSQWKPYIQFILPSFKKICMFIYYNNTIFRRHTYSILSMPTRLNLWTLPKRINNQSNRSTWFNLDGYFGILIVRISLTKFKRKQVNFNVDSLQTDSHFLRAWVQFYLDTQWSTNSIHTNTTVE